MNQPGIKLVAAGIVTVVVRVSANLLVGGYTIIGALFLEATRAQNSHCHRDIRVLLLPGAVCPPKTHVQTTCGFNNTGRDSYSQLVNECSQRRSLFIQTRQAGLVSLAGWSLLRGTFEEGVLEPFVDRHRLCSAIISGHS